MKPSVVVFGSCVTDLTSYVDRVPNRGESILSNSSAISCGGKGANQCIMAAKLGGKSAMVTRVGNDSFGKIHFENFKSFNVDTTHIQFLEGFNTATATVIIDKEGENTIVVNKGANLKMTPRDVVAAEELIEGAAVVVCQNELREETTTMALQLARKHRVKTLMNAAPIPSTNGEIYALCDIVCVNEQEASSLSGITVRSISDASSACKSILKKGCGHVIVTLGSQGAVLMTNGEEATHVPAPKIDKVVDTCGAGDAFVGTMAFLLANNKDLPLSTIVERSNFVAADTVTRKGTQQSYPKADDVKDIIQ